MARARYVVDYRRGASPRPWVVCRIVPLTLCMAGRVWLADFATRAAALAWIDTRGAA